MDSVSAAGAEEAIFSGPCRSNNDVASQRYLDACCEADSLHGGYDWLATVVGEAEGSMLPSLRGLTVALGSKNLGMFRPAVKSSPFADRTLTPRCSAQSSRVIASGSRVRKTDNQDVLKTCLP